MRKPPCATHLSTLPRHRARCSIVPCRPGDANLSHAHRASVRNGSSSGARYSSNPFARVVFFVVFFPYTTQKAHALHAPFVFLYKKEAARRRSCRTALLQGLKKIVGAYRASFSERNYSPNLARLSLSCLLNCRRSSRSSGGIAPLGILVTSCRSSSSKGEDRFTTPNIPESSNGSLI